MSGRVQWPMERDRDAALVIRTGYGDEQAWTALMRTWGEEDDFEPYVHLVDDPQWRGITPAQVMSMASGTAERYSVVYLADHVSMWQSPCTLLTLSLRSRDQCENDEEFEIYGDMFRTVPHGVHEMNVNLMIANQGFDEVADMAGEDPEGVFRGFTG
ncbi:DUF6924 domain-containing protein [Streptomyces sp. NPDC012825]|uniref:DUF6924 domain-containing protein n=1 Tax=Streptomyces sp. NPDC012825 TaxID=3364851 RepID=UPI0036C7942F